PHRGRSLGRGQLAPPQLGPSLAGGPPAGARGFPARGRPSGLPGHGGQLLLPAQVRGRRDGAVKRTASSTVILMGLWVAAILGIGGSYWINAAQQATAEELAARVREAEAAILAHDWATGAQLLAQVQR